MDLQLIAVNQTGRGQVEGMAELGDLPLLQDTVEQQAWQQWAITYRDVVILDGENRVVGVLNLTENNLAELPSRMDLEAIIDEAASR